MSHLAKNVVCGALAPFAVLARHVGQPLAHVWAHTRLRGCIEGPLDPSIVILGVPEIHGTGRIRFGAHQYLYPGLYLETREQGCIEIGEGVVLSRGVHIVSYDRVSIGDGSMVGEYTSIRDANHRTGSDSVRESGHEARPITIGRNAWIGRGVTVLAGVNIGDGAVIGANAVVTKDVAAGAVAAGVPARPISQAPA